MIISFKHRFIFVKVEKVAGTSLEVALSHFCGPDDVMGYLDEQGERLRARYYPYPVRKKIREVKGKREVLVSPHMSAHAAMKIVGKKPFNKHFLVISVTRNPYDWLVSYYVWKHRFRRSQRSISGSHFRTWFMEECEECNLYKMSRFLCTLIEPYDAINFMIRFEHLEEDLLALSKRLGFQENIYDIFKTIHAKGDIRPKSLTTRACFEGFDEGIEKVKMLSAIELERFGYDLPWLPHKLPHKSPHKSPQGVSGGTRSGTLSGGLSRREKENT